MIDPYGLINETNEYPKHPSLKNLAVLVNRYRPDVLLLNSPNAGGVFEQKSVYRMVKIFDTDPWSTVMVRTPKVLNAPDEFEALRLQLPPRAQRELR